jgi:hypothetical protein
MKRFSLSVLNVSHSRGCVVIDINIDDGGDDIRLELNNVVSIQIRRESNTVIEINEINEIDRAGLFLTRNNRYDRYLQYGSPFSMLDTASIIIYGSETVVDILHYDTGRLEEIENVSKEIRLRLI